MNINWYPGHMEKAKRQMSEQLKLVDIVIELRDARMPLSSANPMLNKLIGTKPRLLVLTKKDMADPVKTEYWLNELNKKEPCIALSALNDNVCKLVVGRVKELLKDKLERAKRRGIRKKVLRAMVVGIPNVGKSTFINALTFSKATKVENRPGVTRNLQWVRLNEDLELLDTPGVLWPKFDDQTVALKLALLAAISDHIADKRELALFAMDYLKKHYPMALEKRYGITLQDAAMSNLEALAIQKNWLIAGGKPDLDKTYDMFLTDIRSEALGRITWDDEDAGKYI